MPESGKEKLYQYPGWLTAELIKVNKPFRGFEDLAHDDQTPYTSEEQIEASREQIRKTFSGFEKMGMPPDRIRQILEEIINDTLVQKETG